MNFDTESLLLVDFDGGALGIVRRVRGFAERSQGRSPISRFPIGPMVLVMGGSAVWPLLVKVTG